MDPIYINSGIYQIKNLINGKIYYGSSADINERWNDHKNNLLLNKHSNDHLQKAYNKYSIADFEYTIIKPCPPIKDILLFHEQLYLDWYWDHGKTCYNIAKNACAPMTGRKHTEEAKRKISDSGKTWKHKKHTEETKIKMSKIALEKNMSGENNPNFGNRVSKETRAKMSLNRKKTAKRKREEAMALGQILVGNRKGQPVSEETKAKISLALKERYKNKKSL